MVGKSKEDPDEDEFVAYNSSKSIKSIMLDYKGSDFTSELFRMLLIRREISHLFLSDIEALEGQLASEFPELITKQSIGRTWQGRDINVLTLDARKSMDGPAPEGPKVAEKTEKKADE